MRKVFLGDLNNLKMCIIEARAFAFAYNDYVPLKNLEIAYDYLMQFAPYKKDCVLCRKEHTRLNSNYCSYDCAEEDGAIEK